jgi:transposase-like protein
MFTKPLKCPNSKCLQHKSPAGCFYIKKGYYKTKYNHQQVPRYLCKTCGIYFSSTAFKETRWQKKPHLNDQIYKFYCSAMTLRRMARVLGISRQTVNNKFIFMSAVAHKEHDRHIDDGKIKTNHILIDELHTFEHTKYKPLAITLVVSEGSGKIIDAQVSTFASTVGQGKLPLKYQGMWRPDNRLVAAEDCLMTAKRCAINPNTLIVVSDKTKSFFPAINKILPQASYQQHFGKPPAYLPHHLRKKWKNPLFHINHLCAKNRADLSRVRRKTWITTKQMDRLQAHLYLYIAWNNGYRLTP